MAFGCVRMTPMQQPTVGAPGPGRPARDRRHRGEQALLEVLYSFPHRFGAPGIGWTAWNQVNELVRAGHRVHLVTASVERPVAGLASLTQTLSLRGRRIPHRVVGRARAFVWHDWLTARQFRRLLPDVVHVWPLAGLKTIAAAQRRDVPTVREAPNTHTGHAYEAVAREVASLGLTPRAGASHTPNQRWLAIEEREWAEATGILVPSDAVARTFLDHGHDETHLLRHQYGCTLTEPVRRQDSGRPFTALFLGRGEPRKGLHYALQAWLASQASREGRFLIHGILEEAYQDYLAPMLAHPSVEVAGVTSDALGVLSSCDVLLLPTVEEGSALVTYEAQATGCVPLVSTASGALMEHGVQGLFHEPGDVATLTSQLDSLVTDPHLLARMRQAALDHAPELTWAAANVRLVAAYRRAMTQVGGRHADAE